MKLGTNVRMKGLVSAAEFNGRIGRVVSKLSPDTGRIGVKLRHDCRVLSAKPDNVEVASARECLDADIQRAVERVAGRIADFCLSDYTVQNVGSLMVTAAVARRGEIQEENESQDMCYDAMGMKRGSEEKLAVILESLDLFPLSTESWGMLGNFYQNEMGKDEATDTWRNARGLAMYDRAIESARKLNPTWTADRSGELPWEEVDNRPYLRALSGRALTLYRSGRKEEAMDQAKRLLRLNPYASIQNFLVSWYLEAEMTEAVGHFLRKHGTSKTELAYADVVLQYMLWQRDDAVEKDVRHALYNAIKANNNVPGVLFDFLERSSKDSDDHSAYSPGSIEEAELYLKNSCGLWESQLEVVRWMNAQHSMGGIPQEEDIINLLKSGVEFRMTCEHTGLDGGDEEVSDVVGTQRRDKCMGRTIEGFHYPRQLNRKHENGSAILFHRNIFQQTGWRKTTYEDIVSVPFSGIILQFYEDDTAAKNDEGVSNSFNARFDEEEPTLACKECGSPGRYCALDNGGETVFYHSKECMSDFLEEVDPPFFDLMSETLKLNISRECSVGKVNLNSALRVAGEHMQKLDSVDIYVNQEYLLNDDWCMENVPNKDLILSASPLEEFLDATKQRMVGFSFRLDDCCWAEFQDKSNGGKALTSLGSMPNLKKLILRGLGFSDINVLLSCIPAGVKSLQLGNNLLGRDRPLEWYRSEVDQLVRKLSNLGGLISLSLSDVDVIQQQMGPLFQCLPKLQDLTMEGNFGGSGQSAMNDAGLRIIADNCPNLLSLDINYQRSVSIHGLRYLTKKCRRLVELEVSDVNISCQDACEIISTTRKLLFLRCGETPSRNIDRRRDEAALVDAIIRTNGRVLVVYVGMGLLKDGFPPSVKANQERSMEIIEKANEGSWDPLVIDRWGGRL